MVSFLNSSCNIARDCINDDNKLMIFTKMSISLKVLIICIMCTTVYTLWMNCIIISRKKQWENASEKEIVNKFLEILYLSDYDVWTFAITDENGLKNHNISYITIRNSFGQIDARSKIKFWKNSTILGLSDILEDLLQE